MTTTPSSLVADTIDALESMGALDRAATAGALIAAVQGEGDRRIARIWWAAIAQLHEQGLSIAQIAAALSVSAGTVDLAIQSHQRMSQRSSQNLG
jgi:hypothetical protein